MILDKYLVCVEVECCCLQYKCCQEDRSEAVVKVDGHFVRLCLILSQSCYSVFQQLVSCSYFVNYNNKKMISFNKL